MAKTLSGQSEPRSDGLGRRADDLGRLGDRVAQVEVQRDDGIQIDDGRQLPLADIRDAMQTNGALWLEVLAEAPDPDRLIEDLNGDVRYLAPVGIRLAQVVQHGTDHRSQVCTALTLLGVEPPDISVWAFGDQTGRDYEEKVEAAPIESAS